MTHSLAVVARSADWSTLFKICSIALLITHFKALRMRAHVIAKNTWETNGLGQSNDLLRARRCDSVHYATVCVPYHIERRLHVNDWDICNCILRYWRIPTSKKMRLILIVILCARALHFNEMCAIPRMRIRHILWISKMRAYHDITRREPRFNLDPVRKTS